MSLILSTLLAFCAPRSDGHDGPQDAPQSFPPGPVQVFILAGQSNMEGKAQISLLERQIKAPGTRKLFAHLHREGRWTERDDVFIKFLKRHGKLSVGFGSPGCVGPELEFGHRMGEHYAAPVLLIKTAWGGKSLFKDFRPPSAGLPADLALDQELSRRQKKNADLTREQIVAEYGQYYRAMLVEIRTALSSLSDFVPGAQSYELAGFVWFQGWNDMIRPDFTAAYTQNMGFLIEDVRRDLGVADLPFVIGVLGVDGVQAKPKPQRSTFQAAQIAAAHLHPRVVAVHTDQYWDWAADAVYRQGWKEHLDEWNQVGSNHPYHYLGSHQTMQGIGRGFADALLGMNSD